MCCSVLCCKKGTKKGDYMWDTDLKVSKAQNLKTRVVSCANKYSQPRITVAFTTLQILFPHPSVYSNSINSILFVLLSFKIWIGHIGLKSQGVRMSRSTSQWNDLSFTFGDSDSSRVLFQRHARKRERERETEPSSSRKRGGEHSVRGKAGKFWRCECYQQWFNTYGSTPLHAGFFSGGESSKSVTGSSSTFPVFQRLTRRPNGLRYSNYFLFLL